MKFLLSFIIAGICFANIPVQAQNVGVNTNNPSHSLHIKHTGTDDVLRLEGPDVNGHGARINFGEGDDAFIGEEADDQMTLYAKDGVRVGVNGTPMLGMYSGVLDIGNNVASNCPKCAWSAWNGTWLEIQFLFSALGIPNGTNKVVLLQVDVGTTTASTEHFVTTLQGITTDGSRMDLFIRKWNDTGWTADLNIHYLIIAY